MLILLILQNFSKTKSNFNMIGKYIRGFRHLYRNVENQKQVTILMCKCNTIVIGDAIIVNQSSSSHTRLLLFQNFYGERSLPEIIDDNDIDRCQSLRYKYQYCQVIYDDEILNQLGDEIILLPKDFNVQYEAFINNNKKILENIFSRLCNQMDSIPKYIYALTEGSPNYFVWAINNIYKNYMPIQLIRHCINWCNNYPQLVKNLSKGTITAYNNKNQILELQNELVNIRKNKRINDVINMFNTQQKRLLKSKELTSKDTDILGKFYLLSDTKKHNFIRKMSTITDADEILKQMSLLTKTHFDWSKDSLLYYINNAENINCEIVYDNESILILKALDYETIKFLAKTTNWCISKNKRYWNDYVEKKGTKANQFVMFDFSKKEDDELSIIGFTTIEGKGITYAHSFTNNNLMGNKSKVNYINQFIISRPNIFNVLRANNIPIHQFNDNNTLSYKWDKESFIETLNDYYIDNYDIIYDENNKLAVIIYTKNPSELKPVLGYAASYLIHSHIEKTIIFLDFNKNSYDENRILFSGIFKLSAHEEKPTQLCNLNGSCGLGLSFNSMLEEYDLPYDTICRIDDKYQKTIDAFYSYNINLLNKYLKDETVLNELRKNGNLSSIITESLFNINTLDILLTIYDNNVTLLDIMSAKQVNSILASLIYESLSIASAYNYHFPTEEEFSLLHSGRITDSNKLKLIGYSMALKLICVNESNCDIFGIDVLNMLLDGPRINNMHESILLLLMKFIPKARTIINSSKNIDKLINLIVEVNCPKVLEYINNNVSKEIKNIIANKISYSNC